MAEHIGSKARSAPRALAGSVRHADPGRSAMTRGWTDPAVMARSSLVVAAVAGLAMLVAACGGRGPIASKPTLIPQPTADRTVDAVVRGMVTLSPVTTPQPGVPGNTMGGAAFVPNGALVWVTATPAAAAGNSVAPAGSAPPVQPRAADANGAGTASGGLGRTYLAPVPPTEPPAVISAPPPRLPALPPVLPEVPSAR